MKMIEERDVCGVLSMAACIGLMESTLADLAGGRFIQPPRSVLRLPGNDLFGFMPACLGEDDYFGAKVITAFHRNAGTGYPSHMGYVMLFEPAHGSLVAMVDATSVTRIRTGAVSAVATRLLARREAPILALIGAGAQARSHIEAIRLVRKIERVSVYDISTENATLFAREAENKYGLPVRVSRSVEEAVRDADIICTLTTSVEPFLGLGWVKPGAHVNAVGAFTPDRREVDSGLVAASRLYADEVGAMKRECGEYIIPAREGLIDENHILGSIGDILLGRAPGRLNETDITLFSALGQAAEDVACAKYVYLALQS
jgi:ornithine cyclodeaminase